MDNVFKQIPRNVSDVSMLISKYLSRELQKEGYEKIVPSHGEILFNLVTNEEMTMTEMSVAISKDRSTVTALVSKLIEKDLIEYIKNPNDMRSKKIRLTQKGISFKDGLINISNNMNKILWKNISEDEKEIFTKVLFKIKDNFNTIE